MAHGRVKVPASAVPVTVSTIGGDPGRSRTLSKAGTYNAADADELAGLLAIEGATLEAEPADTPSPATAEH